MSTQFTKLSCSHASLMRYMKRNYPWLENNFKYFPGKIEIPMIGLNPKDNRKYDLKFK